MDFSLLISEIKSFQSSLVELSKSYDALSDKELNKSLGSRSLDNYKEGILSNKENGLRREVDFSKELSEKYPESKGYEIISEAYLRDDEGKFVKDEFTNCRRRIDFVVVKEGIVVDSIEVTSETAPKDWQSTREANIRESGGNYIRTADHSLAKFPEDLITRIERRK
jgi:hypothetical protein